jgi:XTP/dITP diphosphohydrolase
MTQRLILASNNAGKLKEFAQLLAPIGFDLHPQGEFNVPEAEEPFGTFVEASAGRPVRRWPTIPACASTPSAAPPACTRRAMPASPSRMRATARN